MDSPATPRRSVSLMLSEDLLRRASAVTTDLSSTVEETLRVFVDREEARMERDNALILESIAALDALHRREGLLSDEFPSL